MPKNPGVAGARCAIATKSTHIAVMFGCVRGGGPTVAPGAGDGAMGKHMGKSPK